MTPITLQVTAECACEAIDAAYHANRAMDAGNLRQAFSSVLRMREEREETQDWITRWEYGEDPPTAAQLSRAEAWLHAVRDACSAAERRFMAQLPTGWGTR